jgi:hypothetical protein
MKPAKGLVREFGSKYGPPGWSDLIAVVTARRVSRDNEISSLIFPTKSTFKKPKLTADVISGDCCQTGKNGPGSEYG